MKKVGELISKVLNGVAKNGEDNSIVENEVRKEVKILCSDFPLYPKLNYNGQ